MQKTYILNPNITFKTLNTSAPQRKALAGTLPASPKPALPPRQPLPQPVIDPAKPRLKLGLDVHLELIMAVSQPETPPRRRRASSPATNSSTKSPMGGPRFPGLLCAGMLRLRLCVTPRTGGRRRPKFSHHAHRPQRQTQDRQAGCPRPVPALVPLAGWQPRRTRPHPHPQRSRAAPARGHAPPEVSQA